MKRRPSAATSDKRSAPDDMRRLLTVKTMLSRFCYVLVFLLSGVPMISAAESSPIPKHFSAYIGGFEGFSYQLELHDGILTYTTFGGSHSNPKHTKVTPTATQWSEFRQTLDDLKVWQWRTSYRSMTDDGTQWSLDIAYPDRSIKSNGDNNYPAATGKPNGNDEPTEAFNRYLEAVKKLIGGKTFQ